MYLHDMKRVEGSAGVALIECTSPVRNKWRIRWDIQANDENMVSYMEEEFAYKPSEEEIRNMILSWYNARIDEKIVSGFVYEGNQVWLSSENQFNYKAAYDLAVQTAGATLPVTFKFGSNEAPVYRKFDTLEELTDFYTKAMAYVQMTLSEGWKMKDSVEYERYLI